MIFDEAAAEWVRRNYPGEQPLVGSVTFEISVTAYDEIVTEIELSYEAMYRPRRGRVDGEWRHGKEVKLMKSCTIDPAIDLTQLIGEIVEIAAEVSAKSELSISRSVRL